MTTTAVATDTGSPALTADYDSQAFAKAAATGQRVEVLQRREESAQVFANPGGSLTRRQYSTPMWSKLEGTWRATDPTLTKRGDGTIAPESPVFGLVFSGGGRAPLATMTKGDKQLSLSWPARLPVPVLNRNTAVYPSVLPDVDLKIIAQVDGFAEQLIVKTAAAAANPAVKTIKLGITSHGVTLDDDSSDNLLAKDSHGNVVFSAPRPKMWQAPAAAAAQAPSSKGARAATSSSAAAPTASAPVAADVSGGTLTLTPDPVALATADKFPLVIDPPFTDGHIEKWAVVYSAFPTESYPNGSGWHSDNPPDEPRVGYNGSGSTRSFFAMNTNGLELADITDATFAVTETHSWGCDPSVAGPTELWSSGSIDTTPTWNTSGGLLATKLASDSFAHGNPTFCPGNLGHDFQSTALTNYVKQAAANSWGTLVLALKAADGYESNQNSFKRFTNNPVLEVTYNYAPSLDSSAAYEGSWNPAGDGNKKINCGGVIGNSGLVLTAKATDKDGGKVTADFSVTNTTTNSAVSFSPHADTVLSGQTASVTVPSKSLPSGSYAWRVGITDDEGTGAPLLGTCAFTVDREGPTDPATVTTADGGDPTTVKTTARTARQLKLSNSATDLAGFCYLMDRPLSVSGTRCSNGTWVAADSNHSATITVTPTGWPSSTLHVIAYDKADNHSPYDGADGSPGDTVALPTFKSEFVYPPGADPSSSLATADLPGDLNGDGYSDFVAVDSNADAKLRLYPGDGTGHVGAAQQVGTSGWGGALIAHRGDFVGFTSPTAPPDGYEDFLVRVGGALYLYPGNGLGVPIYSARRELVHPYSSWAYMLQMIMPGNIDGKPGNDLITVECVDNHAPCTQAKLWLYSGKVTSDGTADQTEPFDMFGRTEIGSGGWTHFTNLAVGDQNGDGTGDIVARDPDAGKLYLYPGRIDSTTGVFSLGARTVYGDPGWTTAARPLLTSPGNVQGKVVTATVDSDGTAITYHQFQPTPGDEYGDFWATTAASTTATVTYVDSNGTAQSTTCPTGCLLFYPGSPTWHRAPNLVGTAAWSSQITAIY
ncbi:VCBS repeat-containing protein [Streptomyces sp. NPDC051976]|uniref:FG-GAP repeat domain-containing protein n=1 Tax=Streptomyces sp. NPDC051976 TaxID=3154947 RepID=UPI0034222596